MKKSIIAILTLVVLLGCKHNTGNYLDDEDRAALERIKKYTEEGEASYKKAVAYIENGESTDTYDYRVLVGEGEKKSAQRYIESARNVLSVANQIIAMKQQIYASDFFFSSKPGRVPKDCAPCYDKLNSIESGLPVSPVMAELGLRKSSSSLQDYSDNLDELCKCIK